MGKAKKSVRKFVRKGHKDKLLKSSGRRKGEAAPRRVKLAGSSDIKASDLKSEEQRSKRGAQDAFLDAELDEDNDGSDGDEDSGSLDLDDIDDEDDVIEGDEEEDDEEKAEEGEEEDHEEGDAEEPVAKNNKLLKSEIGVHKQQLEALKAKDPEFYAYLQQTDANLLSFSDDEEEDRDADEEEDEDAEGAEEKEGDEEEDEECGKGPAQEKKLIVTSALMNKW
jgi:nucleolar complex protein 2